MFAIYKKELKSYFVTPIGYVFVGLFLLILSVVFYIGLYSEKYSNFEYVFGDGAFLIMFIIPILTMRLFSEERKSGTEQLLLTSPRSITSIVLGKFFAAVTVVAISIVFTLMYFFILNYFGSPSITIAISTMIGFLLLTLAYISLGMFISAITENQIISAFATMAIFLILYLAPQTIEALAPIWLIYLFSTFTEGVIAVDSIILLLAFTIIFVLLTIIVIQKRKNVK